MALRIYADRFGWGWRGQPEFLHFGVFADGGEVPAELLAGPFNWSSDADAAALFAQEHAATIETLMATYTGAQAFALVAEDAERRLAEDEADPQDPQADL